MKYFILIAAIFLSGLFACNQPSSGDRVLQTRIDSLEKKLAYVYKPGLGEFMSVIQVHHAKLWFAGQNQNWKLADFEIHEITEALDGLKKYCADRPEIKAISMIDQPLDSLNIAIQEKNLAHFRNRYTVLTNTCNSCHKATNHEFNIIIIPDHPPFSNQDFMVH